MERVSHGVQRLDWRTSLMTGGGIFLLFGLLETAQAYGIRRLEGHPQGLAYSFGEQMPWWAVWFAVLPAVLWLARTYRFDDGRWRRSAAVHAIGGLAICFTHVVTVASVMFEFVGAFGILTMDLGDYVRLFIFRFFFTGIITYCGTVGVYYAFEYFAGYRRTALAAANAEKRAARLQLSLAEARLNALRMELNPHFLFNALNSIAGLVRKHDQRAAIEMLVRLGDLLRSTLSRDMPERVTLAEEVDLVRRFVGIEQVRFGDRLNVEWMIAPELSDALVPALILQPLVENALRHGLARRAGPATLQISARVLGDQLELTVRDSGRGLALVDGRLREGIGLSNTRARLSELYGPRATRLEVRDDPGGGVCARLMMPYDRTFGEAEVAV